MRNPKFGRGDTIKIARGTPFNRATGSVFVVRNVFRFSALNETVRENLNELMEIEEDTPVYYCSDEINYNCFVPEYYIRHKFGFIRMMRNVVEVADPQDKMYLRVAMIAEAIRVRDKKSYQNHMCERFRREDVHYGDESAE